MQVFIRKCIYAIGQEFYLLSPVEFSCVSKTNPEYDLNTLTIHFTLYFMACQSYDNKKQWLI